MFLIIYKSIQLEGKVGIMAVNGIGSATNTTNVAPYQIQENNQPIASVPVGMIQAEPYVEPQKRKIPTDIILSLATLGVLTYGIIRHQNMKPLVQKLEKATKDGGKLTTELISKKGEKGNVLIKSVKTHFDKDGHKHAEIIHDFQKHERYTVFYDKDGNVTKNVVGRMTVPTKNSKSRLDQSLVNVYTRKGNTVTTTSKIYDYSGKKPVELYSRTDTSAIPSAAKNTATTAAPAAQTAAENA